MQRQVGAGYKETNCGEECMTDTKDDKQKPMPRLVLGVMARALLEVSKVATFGAKKYSPDNWLKVENGLERYTDAKDRHRLEGAISEYDSESGLLHAAHEAWNALAVLELKLRAADAVTESDWPADDRGAVYKKYRDLEKPETWKVGDYVVTGRDTAPVSGEITDIKALSDDGLTVIRLSGSRTYLNHNQATSVEARS